MKLIILLFIIESATIESSSDQCFRLPTSVAPISYRLRIKTHLDDSENPSRGFRFDGNVTIKFQFIQQDTSNITLHAKDLLIDHSQIELKSKAGGKTSTIFSRCIREVSENVRTDFFVIHLWEGCIQQLLNINNATMLQRFYSLRIAFSGELKDNLFGYYRSSYIDRDCRNQTRWLAVTQFEPDGARRTFPCFDEPDKKAKFRITLGHQKEYQALSNMPLRKITVMRCSPDWRWSIFHESPPMATYFVAFSINQMDKRVCRVQMQGHEVTLSVWSRPDAISQVDYALGIGPPIMQYFEQLFNTAFPLKKVDILAVPDFIASAMENWGLMVFKESELLYGRNLSTSGLQHTIALVIAHELAHQWFGNLVTMRWWSDLWLNEGFATYIAQLGVGYVHPQWKATNNEKLIEGAWGIFRMDGLPSSHSIFLEITSTSDIAAMFDAISYNKAACIIRMMHLFLGDEAFFEGLSHYLHEHSYSNAESDDLWQSLTMSAHKYHVIPALVCLKEIMTTWTLQAGCPLIQVMRDYDSGGITISQESFVILQGHHAKEQCWWIPLTLTTKSRLDFKSTVAELWFRCDARGLPVSLSLDCIAAPEEWILFNVQLAGLYRVNYDSHNWKLLTSYLNGGNFNRIHVINRAQLIDDALSLASVGKLSYSIALELLRYLQVNEREYLPWRAAIDNLSNLNNLLSKKCDENVYKDFFGQLLTPMYKAFGGLSATYSSPRLQNLIISWSCKFEVDNCVSQSLEYFCIWKDSANPDSVNVIPLELRSTIYCTAIRHGTTEDWQFLWHRLENSKVISEHLEMLKALGCSQNAQVLRSYLRMCFTSKSGHIKSPEVYAIFGSIASHDVGFSVAKDYFLQNIECINNFFKDQPLPNMDKLLMPLAKRIYCAKEYREMKRFIKRSSGFFVNSRLGGIQRGIETMRANMQWKRRHSKAFIAALSNFWN